MDVATAGDDPMLTLPSSFAKVAPYSSSLGLLKPVALHTTLDI